MTSAPWADGPDGPDGPSVIHCAVPFHAEGVTVDKTWDAMGLRGTGSHTVVLDDVFVPDEVVSLIRPANEWHPVWNAVLASAILARKTMAAESLIATVRCALDVCGGVGFTRPAGLERLYRDVHGALYHPLPAAKQQPFTARVVLGLDPLG